MRGGVLLTAGCVRETKRRGPHSSIAFVAAAAPIRAVSPPHSVKFGCAGKEHKKVSNFAEDFSPVSDDAAAASRLI